MHGRGDGAHLDGGAGRARGREQGLLEELARDRDPGDSATADVDGERLAGREVDRDPVYIGGARLPEGVEDAQMIEFPHGFGGEKGGADAAVPDRALLDEGDVQSGAPQPYGGAGPGGAAAHDEGATRHAAGSRCR